MNNFGNKLDTHSEKKIRLGIIGLGLAGGAMVPVALNHPRIKLVAAAEPNFLLRDRFTNMTNLPAYETDIEMLEHAELDAVYIATPHQYHASQTELAAKYHKHIIVEKPMALTLEDCDIMINAIEKHKVTLIVGHTHSFDPAIKLISHHAEEQMMGRLAMLNMWTYTDFLYRPRRPEELDTSKGGGIIFNQIPHQVDIACLLANSPVRSVRAWTGILDPARFTEGASTVFLDFDNGTVASLTYSGYDYFDSDEFFEWVGATGRKKKPGHGGSRRLLQSVNSADQERSLKTERYGFGGGHVTGEIEFQPHFGVLIATYEKGDLRTSPSGVTAYTKDGRQEMTLPAGRTGKDSVLDELCNVILDGQPAIHHGNFARHTLEVCLAIQRSALQRKEILLGNSQSTQ